MPPCGGNEEKHSQKEKTVTRELDNVVMVTQW